MLKLSEGIPAINLENTKAQILWSKYLSLGINPILAFVEGDGGDGGDDENNVEEGRNDPEDRTGSERSADGTAKEDARYGTGLAPNDPRKDTV